MNKKNYTSLAFSMKLADEDCRLKSEYYWYKNHGSTSLVKKDEGKTVKEMFGDFWHDNRFYPAYDILNDICVKYRDEFFKPWSKGEIRAEWHVIDLLQQGKKQEAEDYIWNSDC